MNETKPDIRWSLSKEMWRKKRRADGKHFSSVASHDDRPMREHGDTSEDRSQKGWMHLKYRVSSLSSAVQLRVSPLLKRTQREKRQADENCFSSVASHDDRPMREHGDTSEDRSQRGFAPLAYQES